MCKHETFNSYFVHWYIVYYYDSQSRDHFVSLSTLYNYVVFNSRDQTENIMDSQKMNLRKYTTSYKVYHCKASTIGTTLTMIHM